MKKILLTAIMLVGLLLGGCGTSEIVNDDNAIETTSVTSSDSNAEDEFIPEFPQRDYDGYIIRILNPITGFGIYSNEHIYIEAENGEVLNDAIYTRNQRVADRFNIGFYEIETDFQKEKEEITKAVLAGEDAYDITILGGAPYNLGPDFLLDFNTLDHLNLDAPWWNQNHRKAFSVNNKLTVAVNSMMITHMDSVFAMFFNKNIAEKYNISDIYELVRNNEWTLDKWEDISKDITSDLDGNGIYNDNDLYSFVGLTGMNRLGSGVQLNVISKDTDDIPILNLDDAGFLDKISRIREFGIKHERDIYDPRSDTNTGGDSDRAVFRLFANNQTLFYVHGLGSVSQFRDMESDFGIIPTPKLDDSQDSYFVNPDQTKSLAVPITVTDSERTALVIECMAYEGYTYLRPLYYETMLQNKYVRDEESIEMMDEYIYTNIGFVPYLGGNNLNVQLESIISGSSEVVSSIESNRNVIENDLIDFIALFE